MRTHQDHYVAFRRDWITAYCKEHSPTTIPDIINAAIAFEIPAVPQDPVKARWVIQKDVNLLRRTNQIPASSIVKKSIW